MTPFMAVGNDELGEAIGDNARCPNCGELVTAIVEFVDSDRALVTTFKPTADLETRALRALTTLQDIAHKHRAALAKAKGGTT